MEGKRIKVVLDTNIFISSTYWMGDSHKIIQLALDKKIEVYTSIEILKELEKVLKRDFEEEDKFIERQIALILEYSKIVNPINKIVMVKDDPDDDKIIECAMESGVDYIISQDKHLLNLNGVLEIKILKPKDFLDMIIQ